MVNAAITETYFGVFCRDLEWR